MADSAGSAAGSTRTSGGGEARSAGPRRTAPALPHCVEALAAWPGTGGPVYWAAVQSMMTGRVWDGAIVFFSEPASLGAGACGGPHPGLLGTESATE
jgi:hypothetical protein